MLNLRDDELYSLLVRRLCAGAPPPPAPARHAAMRLKLRFYVCQLELEGDSSPAPSSSGAGASSASSVAGAAAAAVTPADLFVALRSVIYDTYGDAGLGAVLRMLAVKYYSPATRLCIVRGPAAHDAEVRASLALVKRVKKGVPPAALRILHVAGSLRSLTKAVRFWQASVVAATGRAPSAAEDATLAACLKAEVREREAR
jgi:ribonuclease P/MRP protein subunit POP5